MESTRSNESLGHARDIGALILAYASYAVLLEGLLEAWVFQSDIRWLTTAVTLTYGGLTYRLWKYTSAAMKAALSGLVFLLLLVISAWKLGSVDAAGGYTVLRTSTSTLATVVSILALLAAALSVMTISALPRRVKIGLSLIFVYALTPFAVGLVRDVPFGGIILGVGFWERPPFWLQGGYLGLAVVLPLALVVMMATDFLDLRRRHITRAKVALYRGLALMLALLMAVPNLNGLSLPNISYAWFRGPSVDPIDHSAPSQSDLTEAVLTQASTHESDELETLDQLSQRLEELRGRINRSDFDVEAKAAELGPDVERIFAFVRDEIAYEVYPGVLRGAKGTLMSKAGNALDKSVLLAELLKANGFQVRFASGTLEDDKATQLVRQVFQPKSSAASLDDTDELIADKVAASPDGQSALRRYRSTQNQLNALLEGVGKDRQFINEVLRANGVTLDGDWPSTFASLVAEARQHFWVEYEGSGSWFSLDASFAGAHPGEHFSAADTKYDDIPPALHHVVTFRSRIEQQIGDEFRTHTVVEARRNTEQLAGVGLSFSNVPNLLGGEHTISSLRRATAFLPVLTIDEERVYADGFDLAGNIVPSAVFAGGTGGAAASAYKPVEDILGALGSDEDVSGAPAELTAQWIEFVVSAPGRPDRTYTREVLDRVGVERRNGSLAREIRSDYRDADRLRYLLATQISMTIEPGALAPAFVAETLRAKIESAANALRGDDLPPSADMSIELLAFSSVTTRLGNHLAAEHFPHAAFYRAIPGIVLFKTQLDGAPDGDMVIHRGYDILEEGFRALSEDVRGARQLALTLGILQTHVERALAFELSQLLETAITQSNEPPAEFGGLKRWSSTIDVFHSARRSRVRTLLLGRGTADEPHALQVSEEAKERIRQELADGQLIIVPQASVVIGDRLATAWWRIDPNTGDALGVTETGAGGVGTTSKAIVDGLINWFNAAFLWYLGRCVAITIALLAVCVGTLFSDHPAAAHASLISCTLGGISGALCPGPAMRGGAAAGGAAAARSGSKLGSGGGGGSAPSSGAGGGSGSGMGGGSGSVSSGAGKGAPVSVSRGGSTGGSRSGGGGGAGSGGGSASGNVAGGLPKKGSVPPHVTSVADSLPAAQPGPTYTIGNKTKGSVTLNGRDYVGGDPFQNKGSVLPSKTPDGKPITYSEYDVHPYQPGVNRGSERIVIGSDGSRYYTDKHYKKGSFIQF